MKPAIKRLIGWGTASVIAASSAMIASFEGNYTTAYPDPASPMARALQKDGLWQRTLQGKPIPDAYQHLSGAPWTACMGLTRGVKQGDKFSEEECKNHLAEEIAVHHRIMRSCVTAPLAIWEEAALTSLFYNTGGKACNYQITKSVNAGAPPEVWCDMFLRYDNAQGQRLRGLTIRRELERELCLGHGMWLVKPTLLEYFTVE